MDNLPTDGRLAPALTCIGLALVLASSTFCAALTKSRSADLLSEGMSPMGKVAQRFAAAPLFSGGYMEGPPTCKSELSVACDASGSHVVVAFNDPRGFALAPITTAGYMYSDDGGASFIDGGQLPLPTSNHIVDQMFGHPDIKYCGGSIFLYSAIMVHTDDDQKTKQTIGLYRSSDYGHTWTGPIEVAPDFPNEGVADKQFMDVDEATGRVLISWTNFTAYGTEILSSYSDNAIYGDRPIWSPPTRRNKGSSGAANGAVPRFGNDSNAYIAWSESEPSSNLKNIAFSSSNDKGLTWTRPQMLRSSFFKGMGAVEGCDSGNSYPSMAVDLSPGPRRGNVYVVYTDNSLGDGADVVLQKSTNQGRSFSAPISLSQKPGHDRAQFFPALTVDQNSGRVYVFFYDQSVRLSGDLTQAVFIFSDDGGETWSSPSAVGDAPFHASHGTNLALPNLGEYTQITSNQGVLLCPIPVKPEIPLTSEESVRAESPLLGIKLVRKSQPGLPLVLQHVDVKNSRGHTVIAPGDTADLIFTLGDQVDNPRMYPDRLLDLRGCLTSQTQDAIVTRSVSSFNETGKGNETVNGSVFTVQCSSKLRPGDKVYLNLEVNSPEGEVDIPFTLQLGQEKATELLKESFASCSTALPSGWQPSDDSLPRTDHWYSDGLGLFHKVRTSLLSKPCDSVLSPIIVVPTNSARVRIEFDVKSSTPVDTLDSGFATQGCALRVLDTSTDEPPRLLDSIATNISRTTAKGQADGIPKQLHSSTDPNTLQNASVWGGESEGTEHVSADLEGFSGKTIRLRWDYGGSGISSPTREDEGILIEHVKVSAISYPANPGLVAQPASFACAKGSSIQQDSPGIFGNIVSPGPLQLTSASPPHHGNLHVRLNGGFTYIPDIAFCGRDTFSYTARDRTGAESSSTVNLMVNPAPKVVMLPSQAFLNTQIKGTVLLTDPAPPEGMLIEMSSSQPLHVVIPSTVRCQPLQTFVEFPITIRDTTDRSAVSISAKFLNATATTKMILISHSALTASDQKYMVRENNVLRCDANTLFNSIAIPPKTFCRIKVAPKSGSVQLGADGSFRYVPKTNFHGEDQFCYQLVSTDSASAVGTISLSVLPTLDSVSCHSSISGGSQAVGFLNLTGDAPYGGMIANLSSSRPDVAWITKTLVVTQSRSTEKFLINTRKVARPVAVEVSATVDGLRQTAHFVVLPYKTVTPPQLYYSVTENEKLTISAPGMLERFLREGGLAPGHVNAWKASNPRHGMVLVDLTGAFVYTPAIGFAGLDSFTYKITDGIGESSASTVSLLVEPALETFNLSREVVSGETVHGKVTLASSTHNQAMRVALDSRDLDLMVPSNAIVGSNQQTADFAFVAPEVRESKDYFVTASLGGKRVTALLIVKPRQAKAYLPASFARFLLK